jgi:hypothetical protein
LALKHVGGLFGLDISKKCVDCRKPMVTCGHRALSFRLQAVQKSFHQRNIDMFKPQLLRGDSRNVTAVSEKQDEDVTIRLDSVGTEVPLCAQVMTEKPGEVNGKVGRLH